MFTKKELAKIAGMSMRTFYRRLDEARTKGLLEWHKHYLLSYDEAREYAKHLNFEEQLNNYFKLETELLRLIKPDKKNEL